MGRVLTIVIVVLAIVDALVHLSLDLFALHGFTRNLFTVLFLLNFLGYVALLLAFFVTRSASLLVRRGITGLFFLYPVVTFLAWVIMTHARGNPLGLADISKPVEIVLAVALAVYFVRLGQEERVGSQESRRVTA